MRDHDALRDDTRGRKTAADLPFSLAWLLFQITSIGSLMIFIIGLGALAARSARRQAIDMAAGTPLKQLALALHNYHDVHGQLPPAFIADESGTPIHSWRVLILPFVEEHALFEAYDFSEPWNGPNNAKLLNRMPRTFHIPSEPASSRFTNVVAITGPGTAFPGPLSTRWNDFPDGLAQTILIAETSNSTVPWLAPYDIDMRDGASVRGAAQALQISAAPWRRPKVSFADGSIHRIGESLSPEILRALSTVAGGEPITREELIAQGHLE